MKIATGARRWILPVLAIAIAGLATDGLDAATAAGGPGGALHRIGQFTTSSFQSRKAAAELRRCAGAFCTISRQCLRGLPAAVPPGV